MAADGFKVVEIAKYFGVDRDTIGERFSAELTKGKQLLQESLRRSQIRAARQGNATMLIWLGKQYLGQADKTIDDYLIEVIEEQGLTKEDLLELIKNKDKLREEKPKRSFSEFCVQAGYPPPFPKQEEFVQFITNETVTRMFLGARGIGKTDYGTELGVAYDLYLNPTTTNLIVTKDNNRNKAIVNEIYEACLKNGMTFELKNKTCLRVNGLIGKDHSIDSLTIRSSGFRGRHPKRVIFDDVVTDDDTQEAARVLAKKKYFEIMKLVTNICIIGQPAHQYDLYADLKGIVKTLEIPWGELPELDHDLDAQRAAGVDEASISASYKLKVLSEGTSPFGAVHMMDRFPTGDSAVAFIDPSEGGDYTAISIIRQYLDGIAVVGFVYKKAWNHCLDEMFVELKKYNVTRLAFETNCTGNQPIDLLRGVFVGIGVVGRRSNNNKHSRIMAAGNYAHLIHLSKESHKTYLDHVTKYEYKSKFDDAPDSLATCLEWIGLSKGKQ